MEKEDKRRWINAAKKDWHKWVNTVLWAGIFLTLIKISMTLTYMAESLRWLVKPILNDW